MKTMLKYAQVSVLLCGIAAVFAGCDSGKDFAGCQTLAFLAVEASYQSCLENGGNEASCVARRNPAPMIIQCQGANR